MIEKLKAMVGSMRFWYLVIAMVAFLFKEYGIIPEEIMVAIFGFTGIGIGVRTADKISK